MENLKKQNVKAWTGFFWLWIWLRMDDTDESHTQIAFHGDVYKWGICYYRVGNSDGLNKGEPLLQSIFVTFVHCHKPEVSHLNHFHFWYLSFLIRKALCMCVCMYVLFIFLYLGHQHFPEESP
jgi:hypothetical protein